MKFIPWSVFSLAALAACAATKPGYREARNVSASMILPPAAGRVELDERQRFLMAVPIDEPLPVFPDMPREHRVGASTVCIDFVIDADGDVASVEQTTPEPQCLPVGHPASRWLFPQVERTVRGWSFFAAGICTFESAESECDLPGASIVAVPIRLSYRFEFTAHGEVVKASGPQ